MRRGPDEDRFTDGPRGPFRDGLRPQAPTASSTALWFSGVSQFQETESLMEQRFENGPLGTVVLIVVSRGHENRPGRPDFSAVSAYWGKVVDATGIEPVTPSV